MLVCEECNSMVFERFILNGRKVCDYCHARLTAKPKIEHVPRVYNQTKYRLKEDFKTIANWAQQCNLNYSIVTVALNKRELTPATMRVFACLVVSGYEVELLFDRYLTKKKLKEVKQLIKKHS